jgi:hypothetical protein
MNSCSDSAGDDDDDLIFPGDDDDDDNVTVPGDDDDDDDVIAPDDNVMIPSDYIIRWRFENNGNDEKGVLDLSNSHGSPMYNTDNPKEGNYYLAVDGNDDLYSAAYDITSSSISISSWLYLDRSHASSDPTAYDIGAGSGVGIYYNDNYSELRADIYNGY